MKCDDLLPCLGTRAEGALVMLRRMRWEARYGGGCEGASQPEGFQHARREPGEQVARWNGEAAGQLEHDREARHLVASLHLADVRGGELRGVGQVFLRPSALQADGSNRLAEDVRFTQAAPACTATSVTLKSPVTAVTMRAPPSNVLEGPCRRDLRSRRCVQLELSEFVLCALEARVAEANADSPADQCTVDEYIEPELVNLITIRDVAELEMRHPGFAEAVQDWLAALRR